MASSLGRGEWRGCGRGRGRGRVWTWAWSVDGRAEWWQPATMGACAGEGSFAIENLDKNEEIWEERPCSVSTGKRSINLLS
jgi:hypothetical protein